MKGGTSDGANDASIAPAKASWLDIGEQLSLFVTGPELLPSALVREALESTVLSDSTRSALR